MRLGAVEVESCCELCCVLGAAVDGCLSLVGDDLH